MARPKQYNKDRIQMQVRLSAAVRKRLEREAGRSGRLQELPCRGAIAEALDRWEKEEADASVLATSA